MISIRNSIARRSYFQSITSELRTELIRKSIHILIAFVPQMALVNFSLTFILLLAGTMFYSAAEYIRLQGGSVAIISALTVIASRDRDKDRFVLGPITLGIGAMLALSLYPAPAAAIAIYALAFGDSFSSIFGKLFGRSVIPFSQGKTFLGSFACFAAVFFIAFAYFNNPLIALFIGFFAAFVEALPLKDLDNIILPVMTGALASLFL